MQPVILFIQDLLKFLRNVVNHRENKMTMNNVAMIMAPNLFLVQSGRSHKGMKVDDMIMAAGTSNIMRLLIQYQDALFLVSGPHLVLCHVCNQGLHRRFMWTRTCCDVHLSINL